MNYDLKIGDSETAVDVTPPDDQGYATVTTDETTRRLRITALPPHRLRLEEAGRAEDLYVARCAEGMWVWSRGRGRLVQDAAAAKAPRRGRGGGPSGDVTPPMPAVVQEILVEVGSSVEKGARLVIVSAMKMETTLVAPYPGTVSAVNTEVGAKVAPGDILVEIEKADDADKDGDKGGPDE